MSKNNNTNNNNNKKDWRNNPKGKPTKGNQRGKGTTSYKRNSRNDEDNDYRRNDRSNSKFNDRGCSHGERASGANDISWYTKYPQLLTAAASVPYPYRPGMLIPFSSLNGSEKTSIPGVMSLEWIPTIGRTTGPLDPASIVAKEIYRKVREKYSGALEVDAPDFVVYLMALDSIFAYLAWLKRVFRCTTAYTPYNFVTPDQLLVAMGFDDSAIVTLREQKEVLWQRINTLILMSRKFTCPAIMDIFNRHYWMSDNVYTDDQTIQSQFYIFNPMAVYTYSEQSVSDNSNDMASGLSYVPLGFQGSNVVNDMYQTGLNLIEALVAWDDSYTINGYLQRAYEGNQNFIVEEIPYDAVLTPVYSQEVLSQIENSRCVPDLSSTGVTYGFKNSDLNMYQLITSGSLNVSQRVLDNSLQCPLKIEMPAISTITNTSFFDVLNSKNVRISLRSDSPTVADTVIATRLLAAWNVTSESDTEGISHDYLTLDVGSEIPVIWSVYYAGEDGTIVRVPYYTEWGIGVDGTVNQLSSSQFGALNLVESQALVSQFDWHPLAMIVYSNGQRFTIYGDIHNCTVIPNTQMEEIHSICLYSEFNAFFE